MNATIYENYTKNINQSDNISIHYQGFDILENHISLQNLLKKYLVKIRNEHAYLVYNLGKKYADKFLNDGLSPFWTSLLYERHPKMTPNLYHIYSLRALEIFCEKEKIENITFIGNNIDLRDIIENYCLKTNRKFYYIKQNKNISPKESFKKRLYKNLSPLIRTIIRLFTWLISVKYYLPHFNKNKFLNHENSATIATYFPNIDKNKANEGRFYSRYFEKLHDLLNAKAKNEGKHFVRWLFIRFPSSDYSLKDCVNLCKIFNERKEDGYSFNYIEEFIKLSDIIKIFIKFLKLSKNAKHLISEFSKDIHFENSNINFFKLIEEDYYESFCGWRAFERLMQNYAFKNYVKNIDKQRFILFPLENCPWERMLTYHIHKNNLGKVLGFQHSSLRPTDFRYFDNENTFRDDKCSIFQPDLIIANGKSALVQFKDNLVPEDRLSMAEALRYLSLNGKVKNKVTNKIPDKLLILTSFFADETINHLSLFVRAYQKGLFNNLKIRIKPHPYLPITNYLSSLMGEKYREIEILEGKLDQYLTDDHLVFASNSTTSALEAYLMGLKVMVMYPANDFDLCPIQNIKNLTRIANINDIENAIYHFQDYEIDINYYLLNDNLLEWKRLLSL